MAVHPNTLANLKPPWNSETARLASSKKKAVRRAERRTRSTDPIFDPGLSLEQLRVKRAIRKLTQRLEVKAENGNPAKLSDLAESLQELIKLDRLLADKNEREKPEPVKVESAFNGPA